MFVSYTQHIARYKCVLKQVGISHQQGKMNSTRPRNQNGGRNISEKKQLNIGEYGSKERDKFKKCNV